jgi:hypothetical protein
MDLVRNEKPPYFTSLFAPDIISASGEVLELADRRDLGSRAHGREGSNPSFPTPAPEQSLM